MQFHFDRYEQTSAQEALDYRLTFGKHRSTTLGELGGNWEGRNYLRYLTTTTNMDPVVQVFIGAALEHTPDVMPGLEEAGDLCIWFGQYRGMTLREVVVEKGGMRYLLYIAKWDKCSHDLAVEVIAAEYERQKATTKVVAEKAPPPVGVLKCYKI